MAPSLLLILGLSFLAIGCKADSPKSGLTAEQRKARDGALCLAVLCDDLGRIRKLVDEGADVTAIIDGSPPILHWACQRGDANIVKFLIARGADVRAKDGNGETALHRALFHPDIVEVLIDKGADVNARDCGYTALCWAAKLGRRESAEVLISRGANVDLIGDNEKTPLHLAAEGGHEPVVKLLLAKGANARLKDDVGATPLHLAAKKGKLEVLKALLDHVKTTGSALVDSIVVGDLGKAKRLLSADPKLVKATDSYKWSALHWAAAAGTTEGVKLLLDHGAEIDAPDTERERPLELAVDRGEPSIVKLLLSMGADVKSRKDDSLTGLLRATFAGRTEIVRLLLESGADPDTRAPAFDAGLTSLHVAASYGHREIVSLLIAKGADVNAKAYYGQETPLHIAAERNRPEIAALLLANGADPNAKERHGRTPWDFAKQGRSPGVAKILRKHAK